MAQVYTGGIPTGGFSTNLGSSNEGESKYTPGESEATEPSIVKEGGSGGAKTYDKAASEDFLMDSGYKTDLEVGRPGSSKTVNPDDLHSS